MAFIGSESSFPDLAGAKKAVVDARANLLLITLDNASGQCGGESAAHARHDALVKLPETLLADAGIVKKEPPRFRLAVAEQYSTFHAKADDEKGAPPEDVERGMVLILPHQVFDRTFPRETPGDVHPLQSQIIHLDDCDQPAGEMGHEMVPEQPLCKGGTGFEYDRRCSLFYDGERPGLRPVPEAIVAVIQDNQVSPGLISPDGQQRGYAPPRAAVAVEGLDAEAFLIPLLVTIAKRK